ncbi:MAG: hypothetical protein ACYDEI_00110 [Erysipelotrichaceae bacterium]
MAETQSRKINTNTINGMDLRDFNTDQVNFKEIQNLVKDKDGWRIRDSSYNVKTGISGSDEIKEMYMQGVDKVLLQMGRNINIYNVSGDTLGDLVESYPFAFDFKLYSTPYPLLYRIIDTTNHKTYTLEFTDKLVMMIDEVEPSTGTFNGSAEVLLNEIDVSTGDYTWGGLCRRDADCSENSKAWLTSLDRYSIMYDSNNLLNNNEWHEMALIQQTNSVTREQRYVLVTGVGADSYVYLFDWDDNKPSKWTQRIKVTGKNVFKIDGTGTVNNKARFMDIVNTGLTGAVYTDWSNLGSNLNVDIMKSVFIDGADVYCGSNKQGGAIQLLNNKVGIWENQCTGIPTNSIILFIIKYGEYLLAGNFSHGVWIFNKNTKIWSQFGSGIDFKTVYCLNYDSNTLYAGTSSGVYSYNSTTGIWSLFGSLSNSVYSLVYNKTDNTLYAGSIGGIKYYDLAFPGWNQFGGNQINSYSILSILKVGTDVYAGTNGAGVYVKNYGDSAWYAFNTNINTSTVNSIAYDNTYIICGTTSGCYKTTSGSGTWTQLGTGILSENITDIKYNIFTGNLYCSIYNNAVKILNYSSIYNLFKIYIPNDNDISTLSTTDGTTINYVGNAIANVGTSVSYIKSINSIIGTDIYYYLLVSVDTLIKAYLVSTTNTTKEIGTASTFLLSSDTLTSAFTYTFLNAMTVIQNRYYELLNNTQMGYSLITAYTQNNQTVFDVIDFVVGGSTNTLTMVRKSVGIPIPSTSQYYLGATLLYPMSSTGIASIFANGQVHNVYISSDKRIIQYPIGSVIGSANQMTQTDIDAIQQYYNSEMSRYCNPDGHVICSIINNPKGYELVEVNKSKPIIVRPYYLADTTIVSPDTGTNLYGINTIIENGDTANQLSSWSFTGATSSNTDNGRLYWSFTKVSTTHTVSIYKDKGKVAGSLVAQYSNTSIGAQTLTAQNSSGLSGSVTIATWTVDDTDNSNVLMLALNTPELFNMYEMTDSAGSNSFRTPISIGEGTKQLFNSDDYTTYHKYWIYYLLWSGLFDDSIPYISVAKGTIDPITNNYNLVYWTQDTNFKDKAYKDVLLDSDQLPNRFSNLTTNYNQAAADELVTPWLTYVANDKIFFKTDDPSRDAFNTDKAFWQQDKSILFEIQDLISNAADLLIAVSYDTKSLYYSTGYKYINLINTYYLSSKPTAIQEIDASKSIVACENDLYFISGASESSVVMSKIGSNIGLEKDNYKSLVSNGQDAFFYNRKGVWMIRENYDTSETTQTIINISPAIDNYLIKTTAYNLLGIDQSNGVLYIPLDNTKMPTLQCVMKATDYSESADTTISYNKSFALFDWSNLTFKIFSYSGDTETYTNFFGQLNGSLVLRNGTKLIIPEYKITIDSNSTENPLCRIITKRAAFGNIKSLKKLDSIGLTMINQLNTILGQYGIDYLRLSIQLDTDYTWTAKYGDFNSASYSDALYTTHVNPTSSTIGFKNFKQPVGLDFHEIQITIEFARMNEIANPTTYISSTSIVDIALEVINKEVEKYGLF